MDEKLVWENAFKHWAEVNSSRDSLIRGAVAAGVSKHRIHLLTGVARTTIDRILKD